MAVWSAAGITDDEALTYYQRRDPDPLRDRRPIACGVRSVDQEPDTGLLQSAGYVGNAGWREAGGDPSRAPGVETEALSRIAHLLHTNVLVMRFAGAPAQGATAANRVDKDLVQANLEWAGKIDRDAEPSG